MLLLKAGYVGGCRGGNVTAGFMDILLVVVTPDVVEMVGLVVLGRAGRYRLIGRG